MDSGTHSGKREGDSNQGLLEKAKTTTYGNASRNQKKKLSHKWHGEKMDGTDQMTKNMKLVLWEETKWTLDSHKNAED